MHDAAQVVQDGLRSGRRLWGEARWTRDARQRGREHAIRDETGSSSSTHAPTNTRLHSCALSLSRACLHDARTSLLYSGAAAQATRRPSLRRIDDNPPNPARRPTERNGRVLLLLRSLANSSRERSREGCCCRIGFRNGLQEQPPLRRKSNHADFLFCLSPARVRTPPVDEGYHLVRSPPHQEPHALPSLRSSLVPQAAQVVRFVRLPGGQAPVVYVFALALQKVWLVLLTNQREK